MNTFLFVSCLVAAASGAPQLVGHAAAPYIVRAPIATHQPAPIVNTHHVAQPIFQDVPIHQSFPVTGPVRTHQTVHQPIVHETRTHAVQQSVHVAAAPVAVAHAAPVAAVAHAAAPAIAVGHAGYAGHLGYAGHHGFVGHHGFAHGLVPAGLHAVEA